MTKVIPKSKSQLARMTAQGWKPESATPITDAAATDMRQHERGVPIKLARQLERELAVVKEELRIERVTTEEMIASGKSLLIKLEQAEQQLANEVTALNAAIRRLAEAEKDD